MNTTNTNKGPERNTSARSPLHLLVKTQVAETIKTLNKEKGYGVKNIHSSFLPALNEKVLQIIEEAVKRADQNHRRTLMGKDI